MGIHNEDDDHLRDPLIISTDSKQAQQQSRNTTGDGDRQSDSPIDTEDTHDDTMNGTPSWLPPFILPVLEPIMHQWRRLQQYYRRQQREEQEQEQRHRGYLHYYYSRLHLDEPYSQYLRLSDDTRRYLRELIRRSGNYLAYATLLAMLVIVPNVIYRGLKSGRTSVYLLFAN